MWNIKYQNYESKMNKLIILIGLIFYTNLFSLEFEDKLKQRALENRFYNQINKIHNLHFFISNYILRKATVPNSFELRADNNQTTIDNWPKKYDIDSSNTMEDIIFNVDMNNYLISYTNISISVDENISKLFNFNIAHKENTIFDNSTTLDISIPFDLDLIKFIKKINIVNNDSDPNTFIGNRNTACTETIDNYILYEANSYGGFNMFQCSAGVYRSINVLSNNKYINDINLYYPRIPGSAIYNDVNSTHVILNIYNNSSINKEVKK